MVHWKKRGNHMKTWSLLLLMPFAVQSTLVRADGVLYTRAAETQAGKAYSSTIAMEPTPYVINGEKVYARDSQLSDKRYFMFCPNYRELQMVSGVVCKPTMYTLVDSTGKWLAEAQIKALSGKTV